MAGEVEAVEDGCDISHGSPESGEEKGDEVRVLVWLVRVVRASRRSASTEGVGVGSWRCESTSRVGVDAACIIALVGEKCDDGARARDEDRGRTGL